MAVLTSAVLGILLPEVTRGFSSLVTEWKASREHKRMVELATMAHENKLEVTKLEAFKEAQVKDVPLVIPATAGPLLQWYATIVESLPKLLKFFLSVAAVAVICYMLATTEGTIRQVLIDDVTFTCVAILRFWFGYHAEAKKNAPTKQ